MVEGRKSADVGAVCIPCKGHYRMFLLRYSHCYSTITPHLPSAPLSHDTMVAKDAAAMARTPITTTP